MDYVQAKNSGLLFAGQLVIKLASFAKQLLLAFFLGISADIDIFLSAQIIPAILSSMIAGGAGEVLVTSFKNKNEFNNSLITIFIFTIAVITGILGLILLQSIPIWVKLFTIPFERIDLFWHLSLILVLNQFAASFVVTLKPLLFYKDKYRYYIFTSLFSEIIGLSVILVLVGNIGIVAFGFGILSTSVVNAIFFFFIHRLSPKVLISISIWKNELDNLKQLMKKVFSLSGQTLINHLSTFWERTLSMRYLTPGYLSALNYSKSLSEIPKTIMLSSILTTTYIEQAKRKSEGLDHFIEYSNKSENLLSVLSIAFQFLSIIFAPIILIVFFRRGEFGNEAVISTFFIYQILILGFAPGLLMNFLSRTMYVVGRFRQLLFFVFLKFLIELTIMSTLINAIPNAIPIALVVGKYSISLGLFFYLEKHFQGIFKKRRFLVRFLILIGLSSVIMLINQNLITFLIQKTTTTIVLIYSPLALLILFIMIFYLRRIGILQPILIKIKSKFEKR